ncbi:isochorismatase family cysteine hydrolase [Sphingomonas alba]|uniref:Cysteine hydrolase n=1 Tax=Sphingomonas alba TaxID=2908208 RepID=A0ABT0RKX1_9SPHN|nr:isochorismatase family cysteine hydrolase [Sphingomonas alba]MCL6683218.1 cysteine hydrolase [Sphingomonas alba]
MFDHQPAEMKLRPRVAALVFTDLHNDFLSPGGKAYGLIQESLERNNTAANIETLLRTAKRIGMKVFVSPHYYYPHDHRWIAPTTPLEDLAHQVGLVDRAGPLSLDGFKGSGADFPDRYKPFLLDDETVVTSPHKAYGASTNDMILQLRRNRIEQIILAGPVGNLCVEAHMRDFIEHGFEIAMVRDATAGARNEEGDGYSAAMINWRFLAHAMWSTAETVKRMEGADTADAPQSNASTESDVAIPG